MTLVLFSIFISSFYLQLELLVASSFLYIPLIAKMNTYKWYQLNVLLDDGTFFNKIFYTITKQEYINLVNVVRKEIFDNRIQSNLINKNDLEAIAIVEDYSFQALNIA